MRTAATLAVVTAAACISFVVGARAGSVGAVALLKARSRQLAATHAAVDFGEDGD